MPVKGNTGATPVQKTFSSHFLSQNVKLRFESFSHNKLFCVFADVSAGNILVLQKMKRKRRNTSITVFGEF